MLAYFRLSISSVSQNFATTIAGRKIAGQLIDASTSVAANYRAACRGYTRRTGLQATVTLAPLEQEAHELASIFTASLRTARGQRKRPGEPPNRPIDTRQSDNNL